MVHKPLMRGELVRRGWLISHEISRSVFHPHGANLIDLAPRSGLDFHGWQEAKILGA